MATEGGVLGVIRAVRPQLCSPHDRVAFAINACFLAAGYSLTAVGSRVSPDLPVGDDEIAEVGIEGWNDMEGAYAFQYSGASQEGLCKFVLVKCLPVDDKLMVAVTDGNDKEALQLEIRVSDYVTDSNGTNYGQLYKNLNELVEKVNSCILSKLSGSKNNTSTSSKGKRSEGLDSDFLVVDEPAPPVHGIRYPPVPGFGGSDLLPGAAAGVFPSGLGRSDLLPGAGVGVFPSGGESGVGGMLFGPNDPRWAGLGYGDSAGLPDDSRGILPPGTRYDPIGPLGVPGFEPQRFIRTRRPPGGAPNPDLEHFQPF